MRPLYLLDTCIVSEPAKPGPSSSVIEGLHNHGDKAAIPAVVLYEILYGISRLKNGPKKQRLYKYTTEVMLPSFSIIPYDEHAAWVHGDLRSDLETAGRTISFVDGMIASIAVANNMILVTRNIEDFQDIPHLMIENWF